MPASRLKLFAFLLCIVIVLLGGWSYFSSSSQSSRSGFSLTKGKEVNALTIYHWWTSSSEAAAINALQDVFTAKYPDVAIVSAPVVGGGGFKILPVIKSLVQANEAPDAFQMHAGYEALPFYEAGLLSPIDDIWEEENLKAVVPPVLQDMSQFDGHFYAVPVNVHRSNLLWFNKRTLDRAGVKPESLTSWDAFFAACDTLKKQGVRTPIQMGQSWTAAHVFETMLASEGIEFYEAFINGQITDPTDPRLVRALSNFKKYLSYANQDHPELSWDEATKRIIKGEAAFTLMGDWAEGEFKLVGMKYNREYAAIPAPGTKGMYGLVVDTFQHPKNISHPTNSDRWLRVVASKEGQDAFNPIKGSISARTDSDTSKYGPYQQTAIADFQSATYLYPSVVHGSGMPESFKLRLNDIMAELTASGNLSGAAEAITDHIASTQAEFAKQWSLR